MLEHNRTHGNRYGTREEPRQRLREVPLFVWLIIGRFIRCEEALLEERVGKTYARYKQNVRRWI